MANQGKIDTYTPDPFKNFTPRQNPPKAAVINDSEPQIDIKSLTDDDLRRLARESLVLMMIDSKGKLNSLGAIRELLDRIDGKPAQSIAMTVKTDPMSQLSDARLLRLESELARITGQEAVVISPLPAKLDD